MNFATNTVPSAHCCTQIHKCALDPLYNNRTHIQNQHAVSSRVSCLVTALTLCLVFVFVFFFVSYVRVYRYCSRLYILRSAPTELSDETKAAIVKQVEFYFSDENLPTDPFMKKKIKLGGAQGATCTHVTKKENMTQESTPLSPLIRMAKCSRIFSAWKAACLLQLYPVLLWMVGGVCEI